MRQQQYFCIPGTEGQMFFSKFQLHMTFKPSAVNAFLKTEEGLLSKLTIFSLMLSGNTGRKVRESKRQQFIH